MDEESVVQEIVEKAEEMYRKLGRKLRLADVELLTGNRYLLARVGSELLGQGFLSVTGGEGAEILGVLISDSSEEDGLMALSLQAQDVG